MKKLVLITVALSACSGDGGGKPVKTPYSEPVTISAANTCETAIDLNSEVITVNGGGETWLNYTGRTDRLQIDTCDSGQNGTVEVYFNCEWYESERGTINGRNEQSINDCYPGFYGDVLGIREVTVKIRILTAAPILQQFNVNFNETGN